MQVLATATIATSTGGEYTVELEDWQGEGIIVYYVSVSFDDGGKGYQNFYHVFEFGNEQEAWREFVEHINALGAVR